MKTYLLVQVNEEKKDTNARSGIGIPMSVDDRGDSSYYDREHIGGYRFRWRRRRRGRDLSETHKIDDGFIIPRAKPRQMSKMSKPRRPNGYSQSLEDFNQEIAAGRRGAKIGCLESCALYGKCSPKLCAPPKPSASYSDFADSLDQSGRPGSHWKFGKNN